MAEYVDKEKAIYLVEMAVSKADAMMALLRMDPADVAPVRRGRWIPCHPLGDNAPEGYMCSVCRVGGWEKTNFCPDCGADMRKDGEQA